MTWQIIPNYVLGIRFSNIFSNICYQITVKTLSWCSSQIQSASTVCYYWLQPAFMPSWVNASRLGAWPELFKSVTQGSASDILKEGLLSSCMFVIRCCLFSKQDGDLTLRIDLSFKLGIRKSFSVLTFYNKRITLKTCQKQRQRHQLRGEGLV